jgi:N6-L-threonylcarbamoyladenine synthase
MRIRSFILNIRCRPIVPRKDQSLQRRLLLTLAIETSCDDTAVAVLEKRELPNSGPAAILHFHKKVTSNNTAYNGVHPLASLYSHQENLASLVDEAIQHLPARNGARRLPDFVSVTRGPGMRSNLFTGLDTAKGLAAAWQVPKALRGSLHRRSSVIDRPRWRKPHAGTRTHTTIGSCLAEC